jgi:hypothetical protein
MPRKLKSSRSRGSRIAIVLLSIVGSIVALGVLLVLTFLWNNSPPNIVIPTSPMPPVNAYHDFLRAAQMVKAIPHKSPASMPYPPTTRAGLLAATKACTQDSAPGLAVMRQGFNKPCMLPPDRTGTFILPIFAQSREVARTISGVEMYYELTGQWAKAADVAMDGEEMAVMLAHGGALTADLVGEACESVNLARFENLLPHLSVAELSAVAARLERIAAKRVAYKEVVLEEGRANTAMLQQAFRDPKFRGLRSSYEMAREFLGYDSYHRPTAHEAWETFQFSMLNKTKLLQSNLDYFEKLAVEVDQPYTGITKVLLPENPLGKMHNTMYAIGGRQHHLARQAVLDLIQVEAALYQFKAAKGQYPDSLQEMVPALLKSVPIDPFGQGKPYIYQNKGSSFLLYSVGVDMKDDGGKPAKYPNQPGGDIVAGHLFRAKPLPAK